MNDIKNINFHNLKVTSTVLCIAYIIQHPPTFGEFFGYLVMFIVLYAMNEEFLKGKENKK